MKTMNDDNDSRDTDKVAVVGDRYARLNGNEVSVVTVRFLDDGEPTRDGEELVVLRPDGYGCYDVVRPSSDSSGHEPMFKGIKSRPSNRAYREGWDSIFGAKKPNKELN